MGQRIYFDTNQIYYIRRIADEAQGYEFGDYSWAYKAFPNDPKMVADIKALCYIISLQYQWDLEFCSSDASYSELCINTSEIARLTKESWEAGFENLDKKAIRLPLAKEIKTIELSNLESRVDELDFIAHKSDREIIRDFINEKAGVLFTCDNDLLRAQNKLAELGIKVMRPHKWINEFLKETRGNDDAVDFVERILFIVGS